MKDLRNLKTNAAGRGVPIHPLLIELGLLDRLDELLALGESRLRSARCHAAASAPPETERDDWQEALARPRL